MVDQPFQIDSAEDVFYVAAGAVLLLAVASYVTPVDSQFRFAVEETQAYLFDAGNDSAALTFTRDQTALMNEVSRFAVQPASFSSERLYCGNVVDGRVTRFRFADIISSATLTSVSGSCRGPVDVFVHSQPGGSSGLSAEDRDLESEGVEFTCVQFAEIVVSPVSGNVGGLHCWRIVRTGPNPTFKRVQLQVIGGTS